MAEAEPAEPAPGSGEDAAEQPQAKPAEPAESDGKESAPTLSDSGTVQGRLTAVSDGTPGPAPASAIERKAIEHWRMMGRYKRETVEALTALQFGQRMLDRLTREQAHKLATTLEIAVRGKVAKRDLASSTRLQSATTASGRRRTCGSGSWPRPTRPSLPRRPAAGGRRDGGRSGRGQRCRATEQADGGGLLVPRRLPLRSNGTRLETLSISSLALFWRCAERWRRRYLQREREPASGAMIVGKGVGTAITQHYAARSPVRASQPRTPTTSAAPSSTSRRCEAEFGDEDPAELRTHGREAMRAYLTELAPRVRPVAVERQVELRFGGAEWSFSGYLDVEDELNTVIDVKVGKKHVTDAAARRSPQATSYLLARAMEAGPRSASSFTRCGGGLSVASAARSWRPSAATVSCARSSSGSRGPRG